MICPQLAGHPMPGYTAGFDDDGNEIREFEFPSQREINEQDTPFLRACLRLASRVSKFGNPNGGGWYHERSTVVEICEIVENEKNRYQSWSFKEGKNLDDRD